MDVTFLPYNCCSAIHNKINAVPNSQDTNEAKGLPIGTVGKRQYACIDITLEKWCLPPPHHLRSGAKRADLFSDNTQTLVSPAPSSFRSRINSVCPKILRCFALSARLVLNTVYMLSLSVHKVLNHIVDKPFATCEERTRTTMRTIRAGASA